MAEAFDVLPGVMLPVREVTSRLASMWEVDDPDYPLTFHASQMNVVLHFGLNSVSEAACERFDALVRFAQRYPCRIIVLCPSDTDLGNAMESKLFSQCYIGKSHREMCCCEALILRYNPLGSEYLFNQVSTWLEGDLPTYYWFSDSSPEQVTENLEAMFKLGVRRCVFDQSNEAVVAEWSESYPVVDLAEASLLPVQQIIGQFLSRYAIDCICKGLQTVRVSHAGSLGEGKSLLKWVKSCLSDCDKSAVLKPGFSVGEMDSGSKYSLEMEFTYDNGNYFMFRRFEDGLQCELKASFGRDDELVCVPLKPLSQEYILAEAFFFRGKGA